MTRRTTWLIEHSETLIANGLRKDVEPILTDLYAAYVATRGTPAKHILAAIERLESEVRA